MSFLHRPEELISSSDIGKVWLNFEDSTERKSDVDCGRKWLIERPGDRAGAWLLGSSWRPEVPWNCEDFARTTRLGSAFSA